MDTVFISILFLRRRKKLSTSLKAEGYLPSVCKIIAFISENSFVIEIYIQRVQKFVHNIGHINVHYNGT